MRTPGHPFAPPPPKVTEFACPRPALASILETSLLGKTGKEDPASRSGRPLRFPIYSLCTQGLKHTSTLLHAVSPPCSRQETASWGGGSPHLHDNMPMSGQHRNFKETP